MSETLDHTNKADLGGRNVLFIAYFYPPTESTGVPGSMRTVKFIRHLTGGKCHVLTAPPSVSAENNALSHLDLPVNSETIHRVSPKDLFKFLLQVRSALKRLSGKETESIASKENTTFKSADNSAAQQQAGKLQRLKDFVYNLCYFPDQAGPWIFPATRRGISIVKDHNIDAIFATGSPWSGLITGYQISKATGVPLIIDFRDPWMNNPFHQSKGAALDNWSEKLERKVVEHAASVSLNTEPLMREFLERYPEQPPNKFFVMPNGFDRKDFDNLEPEPLTLDAEALVLCHAGFLYGVRDPAALLEAIRSVNSDQTQQKARRKIVFRQIGDIQLAYNLAERYSDLIEDGTLIIEPPRPYQQCISALKSVDVVVNIQPATKSQVPSKLYDYLAIDKPIISVTPPGGALGQLVHKENFGYQADFDDQETLKNILYEMSSNPENQKAGGYINRDKFSINTVSESLVERINSCTPKSTR